MNSFDKLMSLDSFRAWFYNSKYFFFLQFQVVYKF